MKKRHYIYIAIGSYFLLLLATVPAKIVTDIINDNSPVAIHGVSGSVWNGKAHVVTINRTIHLNNSAWTFTAWKLLIGQVAIDISTHYGKNDINTELGSSFLGRLFVNDLNANLDANDIAELANIPLVKLSGSISINIDNAQWKQGELPSANGKLNWKNATVTVAETASLGNVSVLLGESAQQLLNADINNQGGDIKINGTAELIPEANYLVNILLAPTASASNNIKQSLSLFAKKQSNGDFLLKNTGPLDQIGIM